MDLIPLSLVTVSAISHSYWNYKLKKTIDASKNKMLIIWLCFISATLIILPFFILFLLKHGISFEDIFYPAVFGFLIMIYLMFLSKMYSYHDLSIAYPLAKITPVFTLFIGFFILNEHISPGPVFGIICIVFGAYSIHLKDFSLANMASPFLMMKERGTIYALLTAVVSAFYGMVSKIAIEQLQVFKFCCMGFIFTSIFYFLFIVTKTNLLQHVRDELKEHGKTIITIGILNFIGYYLVLLALSMSTLSYIFALRQMSILFTVLLGIRYLNEKYAKTRLISAGIIILGIILISIG